MPHVIDAELPLVSIRISPIQPGATTVMPWTLSEVFTGLFQAGSDGGVDGGGVSEDAAQYQHQGSWSEFSSNIEPIRFTPSGRVFRGVQAALDAQPDRELCGLAVKLRTVIHQSRMDAEASGVLAPTLLPGSPVLLWQSESGDAWETIMPARAPRISMVRHRNLIEDRALKVKTLATLLESQGFEATLDLGGISYYRPGNTRLRLTWGDKWSILFYGYGATARPQLEIRRTGAWELVRVLRECPPLDGEFWTSPHTLKVMPNGGRMTFQLDNTEFWFRETLRSGSEATPVRASWQSAPLRVSLIGVDCAVAAHPLVGVDSQSEPITAALTRGAPAPSYPYQGDTIAFKAHGASVTSNAWRGADVRTLLHGEMLDKVTVQGQWQNAVCSYTTTIQCSPTESPLLCAFAVSFPRPTIAPLLSDVEVVAAATAVDIDNGDPEILPSAEATFTLSRSLLEQLVPDWETAILPFRPVTIRAKYASDPQWTTLFFGYLTPESASRSGWNDFQIPLRARDPIYRLTEPAALIDERFAPLSIHVGKKYAELYGVQAFYALVATELGREYILNINGNGDLFRFLPSGMYPLVSVRGNGFFDVTQSPQAGGLQLPPPFGSDLKTWIDSIAGFDYAAWFWDAREGAWCYGRIPEFLKARGQKVWTVSESDPPLDVTTTAQWPLLSSLTKSGMLERAYNEVRVWSATPRGAEQLMPGLLTGRAGDAQTESSDPLSVAQSWRRTLLLKPEYVKVGVVTDERVQLLAYYTWREFQGKPPARLDTDFETGFLGPRWGEILHLPTGFAGPNNGGASEDWRILSVKHKFNLSGGQANDFSTTITSRALSASGQ